MSTDALVDRNKSKWYRVHGWVIVILTMSAVNGCSRGATQKKGPEKTEAAAPTAPVAAKDASPPQASVREPSREQSSVVRPGELGQKLYAQHCAACHGERGDGKGVAATFLFPKPRDLRAGRFRLVSTDNNVPTRDDLHAVLIRGMPGSSMPPWSHLSQADRDVLVDEIIRIRREGVRDSYIQQLKDDEGLTDEDLAAADVQQDIQAYVDELTTPGQSTAVPEIQSPTPEAISRGKEVYAKFACISCHGETGRGDGVQEMFDEEKMPTRPRDFTLGIFKGNHDPESLYRRIAYGMPGSPMPGSSTMTPEQMVDLVHYTRSLSTEEQRQAAIPKREKIVAQRVDAVPPPGQDELWAKIKPVPLRMTPLWWRNDADPGLTVQAVHDGQKIALRMTWKDASADVHAVRSESFEDAVAVELYRGPAEPFLGMGDMTAPVDVWFWDADRQSGPAAAEQAYPNAVFDVLPFSETVVASAETNRPGARDADQPDISLPARAVGNPIVPTNDESGGSSLHVGGPRTVTFRVPQSQLVEASGTWSDGRWSVVMTRSLSAASADDGVSLDPGGRSSIAFAVWDGTHQDRDGQKSITIWQELEIEK
jgi:DMSO reductase family type II enzyme heme b subunit